MNMERHTYRSYSQTQLFAFGYVDGDIERSSLGILVSSSCHVLCHDSSSCVRKKDIALTIVYSVFCSKSIYVGRERDRVGYFAFDFELFAMREIGESERNARG